MSINTDFPPPSLPASLYPIVKTLDDTLVALQQDVTSLAADSAGITFNNAATILPDGTGLSILKPFLDAATPNPPVGFVSVQATATAAQTVFNTGATLPFSKIPLTLDGCKPSVLCTLTSYTIGTFKEFSAVMVGGLTVGGNTITVTREGMYQVTLTTSKDTSPLVGGYLYMVKNGVRILYPSITYGVYNSSTSVFNIELIVGDIISFEISGVAMWDSTGLGFKSTYATINFIT